MRVQYDDASGLGIVLSYRIPEFTKREILDAAIERELQVASLLRCRDAFDILDDATETVFDYAPAARFSGQPFLIRLLDAFLAAVVFAG